MTTGPHRQSAGARHRRVQASIGVKVPSPPDRGGRWPLALIAHRGDRIGIGTYLQTHSRHRELASVRFLEKSVEEAPLGGHALWPVVLGPLGSPVGVQPFVLRGNTS